MSFAAAAGLPVPHNGLCKNARRQSQPPANSIKLQMPLKQPPRGLRASSCAGSKPRTILAVANHEQPPKQGLPQLLAGAIKPLSMLLLGALWVVGRGAGPAAAGVIRPAQQLEVVTITPAAVAAATASRQSDSCVLLVVVCLGFWLLSAAISAGIGVVMKLAGRPLAYASGGGSAGWSTAGVMDTFDIMTLPLAQQEEPLPGSGGAAGVTGRDTVSYRPWEGPDAYIPVQMVKVFQPGLLEAGRVPRRSMLQPDGSSLSIVSVTRPADANLANRLPTSSGNGGSSSNGSSSSKPGNENGSGDGGKAGEPGQSH